MTTLKLLLATPIVLAITWWATGAQLRKRKERKVAAEEAVRAARRTGAMEEDR